MGVVELRKADLEQIKRHGLSENQVRQQIERFEKGAPFARLDRPCTVDDGIRRLSDEAVDQFVAAWGESAPGRRLTKFVPASGAATRMFKSLLKIYGNGRERISRDAMARAAAEKGGEFADVLRFIDRLEDFAFHDALKTRMAEDGRDVDGFRENDDYAAVIEYLLTEKGFGYANRPKGQILFHRYPDGARTAFEEHLVEAAEYVRDARGICQLHFTVSPEHESGFRRILERSAPLHEQARDVRFDVTFSRQDPSTDTIAVDMDNHPFREADGSLLFRPGGHGALIGNLDRLDGDLVFIKNVDNVVPDRLKPETYRWKKVLGGCLLMLERRIRKLLDRLTGGTQDLAAVSEAEAFIRNELSVTLPEMPANTLPEKRVEMLVERLDRPLRVCGMVPSAGEPGGGPFWVRDDKGGLSVQIVETAQIDPESADQQGILKRLTHFNPVDVVCSLRDRNGIPYDLSRYVDHNAVFISQKSKNGRDLKALEHPGLWNGAMAFWNTVFVEVPPITFNPVKTINDLLRAEHQA